MFFVYAVLWVFLWGMNIAAYIIYRLFFMSDKTRQEEEEKKFEDNLQKQIKKRIAQKDFRYEGERELSDVLWYRSSERTMYFKRRNGRGSSVCVIVPSGGPEHPPKAITIQDMVPFYNRLREETWEFYGKQRVYKDKNGYFACEQIYKRCSATMDMINEYETRELDDSALLIKRVCMNSIDWYEYNVPGFGAQPAHVQYWLEHTNFFKYDSSTLAFRKAQYKIR